MKLFNELKSRNMNFKNRIIMPPMATAKATEDGKVTDDILNYYSEKTKDKLFSAVIVEHSYIDELGKAHKNQTSVANDSSIEGLGRLAEVIQKNDSLAILQISHAGSSSKKDVISESPVAPSAINNPSNNNEDLPRELSVAEINDIVDKFINAAIRAKKAGFDGVEIHSAHGYLLDQFLSPLTNKRTDEYGGNITGRIKIHLQIIKGIREKLGDDFPILLRMGASDFMDGGLSEADSVLAAMEFEKAGVDILDISGGMCLFTIGDTRPGYFDSISKPIFDSVDIPVILTGGIKKGSDVEDILNRNVCDLVGVGRSVFKDSEWMKNEIEPLLK